MIVSSDQRVLDAALRKDFGLFVEKCFAELNPGAAFRHNWHIDAIVAQLESIRRGESKRLIVNLPPRYLKSIIISVAYVAYMLGHDPTRRIFVASYGKDLACKHAADFRAIVESSWYRRLFPKMRIARSTEEEVETTRRGYRKAVSVGGAVTGIGCHMLIIDDPMKAEDAFSESQLRRVKLWFTGTALSRLDDKENAAIIVTMQRLHPDDLVGHILEHGRDWNVLRLPAIADEPMRIWLGDDHQGKPRFHDFMPGEVLHPSYESLETLNELRRQMGEQAFSAQYLQAPIPPGGTIIKREWLRYYDVLPEDAPSGRVIQSWDLGSKDGPHNSYSVCTTWLFLGEDRYLVDLVRDRFDFPHLKEKVLALAKRHQPHPILIEDCATGVALAQEFRDSLGGLIELLRPEKDKRVRLFLQQGKFSEGHVFLPRSAPFLPELELELLGFPYSKHDDQVDSISQALAYKLMTYDPGVIAEGLTKIFPGGDRMRIAMLTGRWV